jgi:hypothetical protein
MKKHYIIIGIVLISALFFIPAVVKKYNQQNGGSDGGPNPTTLNERIEKIGQNPWDQVSYDALIGEINGLASDQQISASERDNYRSTLNINMQKALAISFKKALTESCYSSKMDFKKATDTISNPIMELSQQKGVYRKFRSALDYKLKLNYFLSGKYSDGEANKLISGFSSLINGEPFLRCSTIQSLRKNIQQECVTFKEFDNNFNQIVNVKNNYFYYDVNSLPISKYNWYKKILIEKQNNEN